MIIASKIVEYYSYLSTIASLRHQLCIIDTPNIMIHYPIMGCIITSFYGSMCKGHFEVRNLPQSFTIFSICSHTGAAAVWTTLILLIGLSSVIVHTAPYIQ